ncbi:MAG: hypothetical protein J6Y37_17240 [Paludibacteraceae bacterium]|nr:hypothetical protein [Paludibacteraceae bacterium]
MVELIEGRDAIWDTEKYDVVMVGTNINNSLRSGFQSKMRMKYPHIAVANNATDYGNTIKLGKRLTIDGDPIISLLYITRSHKFRGRSTLDYDALENCLVTANAEFRGKRVMTTLIGCSRFDGYGDRERVLDMLYRYCTDIDLYVYDYDQLNIEDEAIAVFDKIVALKGVDNEKYKTLWSDRFNILRSLYLDIRRVRY